MDNNLFEAFETLWDQIDKSLVPGVYDIGAPFLPGQKISQLSTEENVRRILPNAPDDQIDFICRKARRIFLTFLHGEILYVQNAERLMRELQQNGFTDDLLPVDDISSNGTCKVLQHEVQLCTHREELNIFHTWKGKRRTLRKFCEHQHRFNAPVFTNSNFGQELHVRCVLPLTEIEYNVCEDESIFLHNARLLADHQDSIQTTKESITVAVREFRSFSDSDKPSASELGLLLRIKNNPHEHLLAPIASFRRGGKYFVLIEGSDYGTLRDVWKNNPNINQKLNASRIKWFLRQIDGLVGAIQHLHKLEHSKIDTAVPSTVSREHDELETTSSAWVLANLRPENIFACSRSEDGGLGTVRLGTLRRTLRLGTLKLAALDILRPSMAPGSDKVYRGPHDMLDRTQRHVLNRGYTWSMGCIIFESLIWLLCGYERLHTFLNQQHLGSYDTPYLTFQGTDGATVKISSSVTSLFIEILRINSKYSGDIETAIGDLIKLVRDRCLVVSSSQNLETPEDSLDDYRAKYRVEANEIRKEINRIRKKAESDNDYLFSESKRIDSLVLAPPQEAAQEAVSKLDSYLFEEDSKRDLYVEKRHAGDSSTRSSGTPPYDKTFSDRDYIDGPSTSLTSPSNEMGDTFNQVTDTLFAEDARELRDDDNCSTQSADTIELALDQELEVTALFATAIYQRLPTLCIGDPNGQFFTETEKKLRAFSRTVRGDTPKTVESKPKRKIAKAIHRLRHQIVERLDAMMNPDNEPETQSEKPATSIGLAEGIPEDSPSKRVEDFLFQNFNGMAEFHHVPYQDEMDDDSRSSGPDSNPFPEPADEGYAKIYKYITTHDAFDSLLLDIELLIRCFRADLSGHIRQSVNEALKPTTDPLDVSAEFHANFDIYVNFSKVIQARQDGGLPGNLQSIVTVTGNSHEAQLETVGRYFKQNWPSQSGLLLCVLQEAVSGVNAWPSVCPESPNSITKLTIENDRTHVSAKGSIEFLVALGQQLAWLGAACQSWLQRSKQHEASSMYCHALWNRVEQHVNTFSITYNLVPVDDNEPRHTWCKLIGNTLIITGFHIERCETGKSGLIVPRGILDADEQQMDMSGSVADPSSEFIKVTELKQSLYRIFEEQLRHDHRSRPVVSLEKALKGRLDRMAYKSGMMALSVSLREVLKTTPKGLICVSAARSNSLANRVKAYVEDHSACGWDWWPLKPRVPDPSPGMLRLRWEFCGEYIYEEISLEEAYAVREILEISSDHPPDCSCCEEPCHQSNFVTVPYRIYCSLASKLGWQASGSSSQGGQNRPSKAQQRYTPTTGTAATSASNSPSSNAAVHHTPGRNRGGTVQATGSSSSTPSTSSLGHPHWVVFGMKDMQDFSQIENIEIPIGMTDRQFFKDLKRAFNQNCSYCQRWCSPYRFRFCRFVQFEALGDSRVYSRGDALPDDHGHGQYYEYHPRPPNAKMPPIDQRLFAIYLKACGHDCYLSRLPSFLHCCRQIPGTSHKWKRIPRKKDAFEARLSQSEDVVFGIEADFLLSFATIAIYMAVSIGSSFVFWIYWLKKHPDDLQNASVPLFTVLSIIGTFWMMVVVPARSP